MPPPGMFQRLDKLRKNAFASVILFGTNNDSSISGVWLFRGQELAFPVSPATESGSGIGIWDCCGLPGTELPFPSSSALTGRSTTSPIPGGSWTRKARNAGRWSRNTSRGKGNSSTSGNPSTRARSSSDSPTASRLLPGNKPAPATVRHHWPCSAAAMGEWEWGTCGHKGGAGTVIEGSGTVKEGQSTLKWGQAP